MDETNKQLDATPEQIAKAVAVLDWALSAPPCVDNRTNDAIWECVQESLVLTDSSGRAQVLSYCDELDGKKVVVWSSEDENATYGEYFHILGQQP